MRNAWTVWISSRAVNCKSGDSTCTVTRVLYWAFVRGMAEKDTYISIAGQQPTVTLVSNGTMTSRRPGTGIARQVLVTPLTKSNPANTTIQQQGVFAAQTRSSLNFPPSSSASQQHAANKVDKVLLKAVNKKGKKDPKTFTLRNVDQHALETSTICWHCFGYNRWFCYASIMLA